MAKGYWIAHVSVTDPESYQRYVAGTPAAFEKYGGRFLARGGAFTEIEGATGRERHVLVEFPSYQDAIECWESPEYQAARAHRIDAGIATIVLTEGLE